MAAQIHNQNDLSRIYQQRFRDNLEYRKTVWRILVADFFQRMIPAGGAVLDLGAGYGEFINQVTSAEKHAMDLNPDAPRHLSPDVRFHHQDCSQPWTLGESKLDAVFTSNFFEHLPDKDALGRTLDNIKTALKAGGVLIAMGPNIKFLPGSYWDFWDHHVALTELSLGEALKTRGFEIEQCVPRFLPYSMVGKRPAHPLLIRLYLKLPVAWPLLGRQFLVVARKP